MIQESSPQAQTNQTTQFKQQRQQSQIHYPKQLTTAADTVTVTELGTLTPNLTIPIAINSQLHQRIVLIQTPKYRTQAQQPQQASRTRFIRIPNLPRSEKKVPLIVRSEKKAPFLARSEKSLPFLTRSENKAPFLARSEKSLPFLTTSENRAPFLARSEPITLLVKKNSLPQNVILKQSPITAVYQGTHSTPIQSQTVKSTDYHYTNSLAVQVTPTKPMTLATMAGIQLTGADESFADMSGAMPTTATVEEINVPVFIDEYLQQSAPTSTTTTAESAAATNINNNHNNSSNNGYGNDICIEDEDDGTFENFDFDIGLIEEEEEQQQMYLCNTNTNNSNNMSNYASSDNNINCFNNDNTIKHNNTNNNHNNTLINAIKNEKDFKLELEDHFLLAPNSNNTDDFLNEDTFGSDFQQHALNAFTEDAIDISNFTNEDLTFADIMTSSQHNPMLCETISVSTNNSQALFTNAEPILPDFDEEYEQFETNNKLSQQSQIMMPQYIVAVGGGGELCDVIKTEMDMGMMNNTTTTTSCLKRVGGEHKSQTMAEKRRKLHLNTSLISIANVPELKTPDVINLIQEMSNEQNKMSFTKPDISKSDIINELLNCSNSSFQSVTAEIYDSLVSSGAVTDTASVVGGDLNTSCYDGDDDLDVDDDESPSTPHSYTSSSHTNHTSHTSPNSPALSIASTSANSSINSRKKRGRPSKKHSDRPDPKHMRHLSENERKKLEDRAKNNEASRLSRLKNKKREEEEMEEEMQLNTANAHLNEEMIVLDRTIEKLKRALKRMQFPPHLRAH